MRNRKKPYDILPEIPFGCRPKVLLVGNGITLSFKDARSVDSIICDEWLKNYGTELPRRNDPMVHHAIWDQPFPLQVVIATKDHVSGCMSNLADEFKKISPGDEQIEMIKEILNTKFDAILTTNYSLEMERSTIIGKTDHSIYRHYKTTMQQNEQQKQFGIFQGTELPYANNPLLWHIHGTALRKNSMIMGQYYYGKLLSEVVHRANQVLAEYNKTRKKQIAYSPKSWIDYFLIGDVHCFGFGLNYSETDIWWLLSLKKSAFSSSSFCLYEKNKRVGIDELLWDAYGINIPDTSDLSKLDYVDFYKNVCKSIEE